MFQDINLTQQVHEHLDSDSKEMENPPFHAIKIAKEIATKICPLLTISDISAIGYIDDDIAAISLHRPNFKTLVFKVDQDGNIKALTSSLQFGISQWQSADLESERLALVSWLL